MSVSASVSAANDGKRFYELDSLRGLAAVSVVLFHYHAIRLSRDANPGMGHVGRAVMFLLRPIYGGHESVVLFFLLSGFVLSLPNLRRKSQPYPAFLVRRIIRIYLPYLVALAFATVCVSIWHGQLGIRGVGAWIWWVRPSMSVIFQHILFLGVYDERRIMEVSWSLVHELRISILFPLAFLLVNRLRGWASVAFAISCTVAGFEFVGQFPQGRMSPLYTVHYLAFFVLGALLAKHENYLGEYFRSRSVFVRYAFFGFSFLLFSYGGVSELKAFMSAHITGPAEMITDWLAALGGVGYMLAALNMGTIRQLLLGKSVVFLGQISYSLYLVHFTVLMVILFLSHGHLPMMIEFPLYLVCAFSLATAFHHSVERPLMQLSRQIGARMTGRKSKSFHSASDGAA